MAQPNRNRNKRPLKNLYWFYALIILALCALYYFQDGSQVKTVDWTTFEQGAAQGDVDKIVVFSESPIKNLTLSLQSLTSNLIS